jgi:hypothetical protein
LAKVDKSAFRNQKYGNKLLVPSGELWKTESELLGWILEKEISIIP